MILQSSFTSWMNHFIDYMGAQSGGRLTILLEIISIHHEAPLELYGKKFFHFKLSTESSGCFGCCSKSRPITAVDEPSKGLRIQGQTVKKSTLSDDFWSTSTCDIDFSAVQSQRSLSSISISNVSLSQSSGTTSAGIQSEFVNHGKFSSLQLQLI
ncbi:hypothetical protein Ccrd_004126 [Cynara cardunculus var. scolymus]|uniref:Uncharacterized protein n=1 Tax=Cynara cardunculus var. scolymus TaxID=59895 RepID=A0A118JW88_CYNCS|nr:hypothetical protein Ccrd_004126 [Cynara cardunculus var. scolymus]